MTEKLTTYELELPNNVMSFELLEDDSFASEGFQIDEAAVGNLAIRNLVKSDFDLAA